MALRAMTMPSGRMTTTLGRMMRAFLWVTTALERMTRWGYMKMTTDLAVCRAGM
jgi:hypothetical protein